MKLVSHLVALKMAAPDARQAGTGQARFTVQFVNMFTMPAALQTQHQLFCFKSCRGYFFEFIDQRFERPALG
jgi:hypothetical protein